MFRVQISFSGELNTKLQFEFREIYFVLIFRVVEIWRDIWLPPLDPLLQIVPFNLMIEKVRKLNTKKPKQLRIVWICDADHIMMSKTTRNKKYLVNVPIYFDTNELRDVFIWKTSLFFLFYLCHLCLFWDLRDSGLACVRARIELDLSIKCLFCFFSNKIKTKKQNIDKKPKICFLFCPDKRWR